MSLETKLENPWHSSWPLTAGYDEINCTSNCMSKTNHVLVIGLKDSYNSTFCYLFYDLYVLLHKQGQKHITSLGPGSGKKSREKATARLASLAVIFLILGTCQKLAGVGGEGDLNRGRVTTFWDCRKGRGHEKWAVKRGRVMQIYARDHVEVHPQKKKEVLYLVKNTWEK